MNVARSSRYDAKSASGMPLTIRSPQNGGVGTGLVDRDVGAGRDVGGGSDVGGVATLGLTRRSRSSGSSRTGDAALDGHQRVHQPQALERVAGVADLAVVQLRRGPARRRRG